jgi:hypothetical protein
METIIGLPKMAVKLQRKRSPRGQSRLSKVITVRCLPDIRAAVEAEADRQGVTMSAIAGQWMDLGRRDATHLALLERIDRLQQDLILATGIRITTCPSSD